MMVEKKTKFKNYLLPLSILNSLKGKEEGGEENLVRLKHIIYCLLFSAPRVRFYKKYKIYINNYFATFSIKTWDKWIFRRAAFFNHFIH